MEDVLINDKDCEDIIELESEHIYIGIYDLLQYFVSQKVNCDVFIEIQFKLRKYFYCFDILEEK